jgi:hypothetical protein
VPDDAGDGKPTLVVLGYDAVEVSADNVVVPDLAGRIYAHKGASEELRLNRNNLAFLLADKARKPEMKQKMAWRLALNALRRPEKLNDFAEHQRERILEWWHRSEQELALAIQQCYRHVLYPSRNRIDGASLDLAHTAIDVQSASDKPGQGQKQVIEVLRANNKLRLPEDDPDSPAYIRDRTPLKKGKITTATLRAEFRRDPGLPMLVGDDVFVKGIRRGIEAGAYVYQRGDLLCGAGDPWASIHIDEQSFVYTSEYAHEHDIWPKVQDDGTSNEDQPGDADTGADDGTANGDTGTEGGTGTTPGSTSGGTGSTG